MMAHWVVSPCYKRNARVDGALLVTGQDVFHGQSRPAYGKITVRTFWYCGLVVAAQLGSRCLEARS